MIKKDDMFSLLCRVLVFWAVICAFMCSHISTASFSQRSFRLQTSPLRGPKRLNSTWYTHSRAFCAGLCMCTYPDDCKTFLFNSLTGSCIPGSWVQDGQPLPTTSEGDLYNAMFCNESEGFQVLEWGAARACIGVFEKTINYTAADIACQMKGAFLMSVKTKPKLTMLRLIASDFGVWVGCHAIGQTQEFFWKEDGEKLTNETINDVFLKGEPNNYKGVERCVRLSSRYFQLVDSSCDKLFAYACEISIP